MTTCLFGAVYVARIWREKRITVAQKKMKCGYLIVSRMQKRHVSVSCTGYFRHENSRGCLCVRSMSTAVLYLWKLLICRIVPAK